MARDENIGCFSVVSAQGANPSRWACDHVFLHPLLYSRTKGEMERELMRMGFPCLHIFRPGLLNRRKNDQRFLEEIAMKIFPALDVEDLASFMLKKSIEYIDNKTDYRVKIFENRDMIH